MIKKGEKIIKNKEDIISMFLGLIVVVVLALVLVNFIQRRKGNIEVPGIKNEINSNETVNNAAAEKTVTVVKGDSLWKIAVKNYNDGYKWTEIAKANNLKNPGLLYSGQKLVLPAIEEATTATTVKEDTKTVDQNTEYTVLRGDSLWKIAIKFYNDGYKWTEIWEANKDKIRNPDKLEIGMKLLIYGKI